jgi:hypothetical protein
MGGRGGQVNLRRVLLDNASETARIWTAVGSEGAKRGRDEKWET